MPQGWTPVDETAAPAGWSPVPEPAKAAPPKMGVSAPKPGTVEAPPETGFLDSALNWATTPFSWAQRMRERRRAETEPTIQAETNRAALSTSTPDDAWWAGFKSSLTSPANWSRARGEAATGFATPLGVAAAAAPVSRTAGTLADITSVGLGARDLAAGDYGSAAVNIGTGTLGALGTARAIESERAAAEAARAARRAGRVPTPPPSGIKASMPAEPATGTAYEPGVVPAGPAPSRPDISQRRYGSRTTPEATTGATPRNVTPESTATGTPFKTLPQPPTTTPLEALEGGSNGAFPVDLFGNATPSELKMPTEATPSPVPPSPAARTSTMPSMAVPAPEAPAVPPPPGAPEGLGAVPGATGTMQPWEAEALNDLRNAKQRGAITDDQLMVELTKAISEGGPQSAYAKALTQLIGGNEGMPIKPAAAPAPAGKPRGPLGAKATEAANAAAKRAFAKEALSRLQPTPEEKKQLRTDQIGNRATLPAEVPSAPAPKGPATTAEPTAAPVASAAPAQAPAKVGRRKGTTANAVPGAAGAAELPAPPPVTPAEQAAAAFTSPTAEVPPPPMKRSSRGTSGTPKAVDQTVDQAVDQFAAPATKAATTPAPTPTQPGAVDPKLAKRMAGMDRPTLTSLISEYRRRLTSPDQPLNRDELTTYRAALAEAKRRGPMPAAEKTPLQQPTPTTERVSADEARQRGFVYLTSGPKAEMRDVIAKLQDAHGSMAYRVTGLGKSGYRIEVDPSVVGTQAQTAKGVTGVEPAEVAPNRTPKGSVADAFSEQKAATPAVEAPPAPAPQIKPETELAALREALQKAPSTMQAKIRARIQELIKGEGGEWRMTRGMQPAPYRTVEELRKWAEEGPAKPGTGAQKFAAEQKREGELSAERRRPFLERLQSERGEAVVPGAPDWLSPGGIRDRINRVFQPAKTARETVGEEPIADVISRFHDPDVAAVRYNNHYSEALDDTFANAAKTFASMPTSQQRLFNRLYGEARTPEGKALQTAAAKDPATADLDPAMKKAVKEATDYVHQVAEDAGFKLGYHDDYFYGSFKNEEATRNFLDHWRTTENFTKQKLLPTRADAEAAGLTLKDENPFVNAERELRAVSMRASMKGLLDHIEDAQPAYSLPKEKAPKEWRKLADPLFDDYRFDPDYAHVVNSFLERNRTMQEPLSKALHDVSQIGAYAKLYGSLFHPKNIVKAALANELGAPGMGRGLAQMTKQAFKEIDETSPAYLDYVGNGGGHRGSLEALAANRFANLYERSIYNAAKGTPFEPLLGKANPLSPMFMRSVFDEFIPRVKYQSYLNNLERLQADKGGVATAAEKQELIRRGDEMFGEINERLFGRSGTMTSALRIPFMAPGYAEGNFRIMARSMGGDKKAIGFIVKSLGITAATAALMTRAMTGQWPSPPKSVNDLRDAFKSDTGLVDAKGQRILLDWMTYEKDPWMLFGNAATGKMKEIPKDFMDRFGGMVSPTISMLNDFGTFFTKKVVTDQIGHHVYENGEPWGTKLMKLITYEGKQLFPIIGGVAGQFRSLGFDKLTSAAGSILGLTPTKSEADKAETQRRVEVAAAKRARQEERYQRKRTLPVPPPHRPTAPPPG